MSFPRKPTHLDSSYHPTAATTGHSVRIRKAPDRRSTPPLGIVLGLTVALLVQPLIGSAARGDDAIDPAPKTEPALEIDAALEAIRGVGREGDGFADAIPAADRLRDLPPDQIVRLFDAAADTNPVAENWIRGLALDIARRGGDPPLETLREYVADETNDPTGRGLAMELIRKQAPDLAETMIDQRLNDPSLAIREMAVEREIGRARKLADGDDKAPAITRYRDALAAARHPKQLERILEALGKLGDDVTTADAFAMITDWYAVAPFDNEGGVGFDAVYPPEARFAAEPRVDLDAEYEGKDGTVRWRQVAATGDEGIVDLAAAFDKEKGAVAYLYAEFDSSQARDAEARLACINANKVWLNGDELMATEVYHAGVMIDQYVAPCELVEGTNRILLKVCQNEQTESWAQRWQFQFRLTDPAGKGLRDGE